MLARTKNNSLGEFLSRLRASLRDFFNSLLSDSQAKNPEKQKGRAFLSSSGYRFISFDLPEISEKYLQEEGYTRWYHASVLESLMGPALPPMDTIAIQAEMLMAAQSAGQEGELLTDGRLNIFFGDPGEGYEAWNGWYRNMAKLCVWWKDGKWKVSTSSTHDRAVLYSGHRMFFSNPKGVPQTKVIRPFKY